MHHTSNAASLVPLSAPNVFFYAPTDGHSCGQFNVGPPQRGPTAWTRSGVGPDGKFIIPYHILLFHVSERVSNGSSESAKLVKNSTLQVSSVSCLWEHSSLEPGASDEEARTSCVNDTWVTRVCCSRAGT